MVDEHEKQHAHGRKNEAFECSLKEYLEIQPVFTHVQLGKVNTGHPREIEHSEKYMVFLSVQCVGSEDSEARKQQYSIQGQNIP